MRKAGRSVEGTATVHTPAAPLPSPLSPASVCISHSAVLPSLLSLLFFLLLLVPFLCSKTVAANEIRDCTSADLIFQYTACDQNNKRWLFAVPRSHNFLCSADSMPPPRHGLNCTVTCPGGHFLEMRSQECRLCQPGTFSLGDRVRYEQFGEDGKLPDGFSVENTPEESFGTGGDGSGSSHCASGGGWTVEEGELRYRWTGCVSTLSISLHLTRPGFAEFQYQLSKDSRALIQMLQVRNAQCQSYGHTRNPLVQWRQKSKQSSNAGAETAAEQGPEGGADIRVQRLALRRGQNLITWTVAVNPVLSSRMEMIRLIRLDISGLAFSPVCSPCPAGTFTAIAGAQQCEPCGLNEFAGPGAARCQQCLPSMWAGPRSELCRPRPACSAIDFFPVRPTICQSSSTNDSSSGGQQKIYQRKISPQICRDDALFAPNIREEPCPPCGPGMQRTGTGKCELCPEGQVSAGGEACSACSHGWIAERGLFLNRWDSLPTGLDLKMECEFLSAEETPTECRLSPSWISHGDRLESVQTRMRGLALELSLHLRDGFYSPLHSGKASTDNPLGHISLELELQCRDSCQFYVVQEFEAQSPGPVSTTAEADTGRQLQMLALLNGTQPRRRLLFPVMDPRPRRLLIAFTRSGALLERDELTDRAIIYSLNVTNTGRPTGPPKATGQGRRCVQCPRLGAGGQCQPCPPGEYWAWQSCHQCPPGTVVNQTAAMESSDDNRQPPCSPCPAHFERSADGFSCEFSGHFELADEPNGTEKLHFDLSALRESGPLTARGIRVFSRDGQSYQHQFNFSLFPGHWVRCRDSMAESASSVGGGQPAQAQQEEADAALFCRSAAIPLQLQNDGAGGDESRSSGGAAGELFVSSTILSRKLALVSRQRQFAGFHLSDEQLEYEPDSAKAQRPLDMHFFFEPLPALGLSNCPNGTIAVATVRCEPTAVLKPLARLSRRCPDGTCDGCLYHAVVESAHGCPVCTAQDYREIRGECINDRQIVHLIPAKHCVLSGTHSQQQREESCRSVLSARVRLILAISVGLILTLLLVILFIYRRNRTLEYRYSRLVEGREMDSGVRSCALGSEQDGSEEEEDSADDQQEMVDSSRARVFFSTKRAKKTPPGGKYSQRSGRAEERAEFIAEEESD